MAAPDPRRDRLVEAAIGATGLDDLGEPTWCEGLDRLLDDLDRSADLSELGVTIVETEVTTYLANRLRIVDWRRGHPDVALGAVQRPLVICGQPRTGTTILYDLLAQDPAHRAPLSWEVDFPVPPPTPATYEDDPRIDECQALTDMVDVVIPGFTDFHPMGARLAQECVRMTGSEFRSMIFHTQYNVPEYDHWLLYDADLAPAYRWHRTYLQHLQSRYRGDRWLLKSPAHLWHLGELVAQYPDAVVIQTHRDPLKVIASVSALVAHLRRMASDRSPVAVAAAQYADDIFLGLDRSLDARRDGTLHPDQVIDVQFADFMADPFATIGSIYDRLGVPLTADAEARMRSFLASHPGDGGGGWHPVHVRRHRARRARAARAGCAVPGALRGRSPNRWCERRPHPGRGDTRSGCGRDEDLLEDPVDPRAVQGHPPVDDDVLPGDEAGQVRAEEDHHVGDVLGLTEPARAGSCARTAPARRGGTGGAVRSARSGSCRATPS